MQDFLILELPSFRPHYRKWKKYGYTKPAERTAAENQSGGESRFSQKQPLFPGGAKAVYGAL